MKANKKINMVMIAAAAVVLTALNVGVLMAARNGAIAPIDNLVLWGGFVVLNVVSILWAISLLGLQPLVVSLSYAVGGYLAFRGVRGMEGINVAEVATAGATYGAFGALAVGNATVKVRLAFFNKGQVPFIFIIVGLLVLDAGLNSGISHAGMPVYLNAVLIPFALAGAVIGVTWSVLNRFGIGCKPSEVIAALDAAEEAAVPAEKSKAADQVIIPMPEHAVQEEKKKTPAPAVAAERKARPAAAKAPDRKLKPVAAKVSEPEPVVAAVEEKPPVEEPVEETFIPLEIDKGEEVDLPEPDNDLLEIASMLESEDRNEEAAFEAPSFGSGAFGSSDEGGVMLEEPAVSVSLDLDAEPEAVVKAAPAPVEAEAKPEPEPEPAPQETQEKSTDDDWLGGHLDLLNKLK